MDNIDARLRAVIEDRISESRRFKELQDATGIDGNRWKAVWHGRQRVMPDMIEAIAQLYPQYAFWLATGITDPAYGHVAPKNEGYPLPGQEQTTSTRYFQDAIAEKKIAMEALQNWLDEDQLNDMREVFANDWHLRSAHQLAANPTALKTQKRTTSMSAQLRAAEVAMYKDMPTLDYDETEAVLKSIERHLEQRLPELSSELPNETAAVTDAIARLKARIARHREQDTSR
ncbi:hypothetical protein BTM_1135 [Burkholderia thailandensis 34]|uniref:hypothetical protein n=1 Tax=Burkholderia thailandensis TaxID=57975 RepID=UPI0005D99903|nr:hypothetical protein [Burkholderia thailandensis]AJY29825.1 hypothetical protein BTM_1135 [Burkholderia thailandensis 34]